MFLVLDDDFQREEIFQHIPSNLQALLSKQHKQIADKRKSQEIFNTSFKYEELVEARVSKLFTYQGSVDNHVLLEWNNRWDEEWEYYELCLDKVTTVKDGRIIIRTDRRERTGNTAANYLFPHIDSAKELTRSKYNSKEEVRVYYSLSDIYKLYLIRCNKLYLSKEYATQAALNYRQNIVKNLLEEEIELLK